MSNPSRRLGKCPESRDDRTRLLQASKSHFDPIQRLAVRFCCAAQRKLPVIVSLPDGVGTGLTMRRREFITLTYHSKIKILGQVKSEKVVAKGFSNEVKKHNLTTDADPNVGVFNLYSRQTSPSQQRVDVDALSQRARKREPRHSALGAWEFGQTLSCEIAHTRSQRSTFVLNKLRFIVAPHSSAQVLPQRGTDRL